MGTIFDREHEPPDAGPEDTAFAFVTGVVSTALTAANLPGVGELLASIIGPPLARRQQEWMQDIAAAIRKLESQKQITDGVMRAGAAA